MTWGSRLRSVCLFGASMLLALGPVAVYTTVRSQLGFVGRYSILEPSAPSPPPVTTLAPGLLREEFDRSREILGGAPQVDPKIQLDFTNRKGFVGMRVQFTGWLLAPRRGEYGFELTSDDGGQLLLDGKTVVENWGHHGPVVRRGQSWLEKGLHRVRIEYEQVDGSARLQWRWRPPGGEVEVVPAAVLFHSRAFETKDRLPGALNAQVLDLSTPLSAGLWFSDYRHSLQASSLVGAGILEGRGSPLPAAGSRWRVIRGRIRSSSGTRRTLKARFGAPGRLLVGDRAIFGGRGDLVEGPMEATLDLPVGWHPLTILVDLRSGASAVELAGPDLVLGHRPFDLPEDHQALLRDLDGVEADPLLRRRDPHLSFLDPSRLLTPYWFRWDVGRRGPPTRWPTAHVSWRGHLKSPRAGWLKLEVEASGTLRIQVGNEVRIRGAFPGTFHTRIPVREGFQPVRVDWVDPTMRRLLDIRTGLGNDTPEPLGANHITLEPVAPKRLTMVTGLVILGLIFVLTILGGGPSRQAGFLRAHGGRIALCVIVLLGLGLRLQDYEYRPFPGNVDDEYNHHLIGHSLLGSGLPIGWDFRDHYEHIIDVPFHGRIYKMAVPFVFYPPLFSCLVSVVARVAGYPHVFETPLHVTRLIPITLATLSIPLVYLVGRRMRFDRLACLLAAAHFATFPFFIVNHRLVKEENLVAFLFLLLLLVAVWSRDPPGPWRRTLAGLLIVAGLLTKQMAIAFPAVVFTLWFSRSHRRAALLMLAYGVLGIALFWLYGSLIHPESFLQTQRVLTHHGLGLDALYPLISQARVVGSNDLMPSMFAGCFVIVFMTLGRAQCRDLSQALVLYLVAVLLSYNPRHNYGWYRLPIYPLVSLCWGIQARLLLHRFDPARALLFTGLFLLPALHMFLPPGPLMDKSVLRTVTLLFLTPAFIGGYLPRQPHRALARATGGALIAACLITSSSLILIWERIDRWYWPPDPGGKVSMPLDPPPQPPAKTPDVLIFSGGEP